MVRIHTASVVANVVDNRDTGTKVRSKRASQPGIHNPMDSSLGSPKTNPPVAKVVAVAGPLPATSEVVKTNLTKKSLNEPRVEVVHDEKVIRHSPHSIPSRGIIFYTTNRLPIKLAKKVQDNIKSIGLPITSTSLKPMDMGKNIVMAGEPGYEMMFRQILAALEHSKNDIIFFCEHDNLYPKEHFYFTPTNDNFWYNRNWWKVRADGLAVSWEASQVSGLCVYRETALKWYRDKVASFDADTFDRKFEPPGDDSEEWWMSEVPYIDIRGNWNMTYNKWKLDHFRKKETAVNFRSATINHIPGWSAEQLSAIIKA